MPKSPEALLDTVGVEEQITATAVLVTVNLTQEEYRASEFKSSQRKHCRSAVQLLELNDWLQKTG